MHTEETEGEARLADAAFAVLAGGETVFLDSSSTAYLVACRIAEGACHVKVITNSGPIMQVLACVDYPKLELFAVGGTLRRPPGSYVGPASVSAIRQHFADKAFLSVTGMTPSGVLTDADEHEAAVKRAMIEQAEEAVLFLLDTEELLVFAGQALDRAALFLRQHLG